MSSFDICEDVCDRIDWTLGRIFLDDEEALELLCLWLPAELREVMRRMGSALRILPSMGLQGALRSSP